MPAEPVFTGSERLALAGFLAGYSGLTRKAYALDLRQFAAWCHEHQLRLFGARRADIECFGRDLEARGRARATVTRRRCTIAGFYKYAVEEELLDHSPADHVRRPRIDYESHATGLDRNEMGALLVAAGLAPPAEHALISLLALNGLRVSEATGADIEALGLERGHRTLTATRKGGKIVTIPLGPRTARAIDLAIGERCEGSVFLARTGDGWTGTAPGGSCAGWPGEPGSTNLWARTRYGMRSSPPRLTPGCRCGMCRKPPRTPIRVPRCVMTGQGPILTGTPPTSSPRSSPEPPADPPRQAVSSPGRPQPGHARSSGSWPATSSAQVTDQARREQPWGPAEIPVGPSVLNWPLTQSAPRMGTTSRQQLLTWHARQDAGPGRDAAGDRRARPERRRSSHHPRDAAPPEVLHVHQAKVIP